MKSRETRTDHPAATTELSASGVALAGPIAATAVARHSPANDTDDLVAGRVAALVCLPVAVERLQARVERLEQAVEVLRQGDPDQLLDTEQAAELLGMSEAAVRQAARRGTLPAEYRGRRLRFRRGALLSSGRPRGRRQRG